jgi:hypothetical protein
MTGRRLALGAAALLAATALWAQNQRTISPQGSISGTLVAVDGKRPAPEVRVSALSVGDGLEGAESVFSLTRTDSAGSFLLENLPPGRYLVTAGQVDVPTYFPGAPERSEAIPITVGAGQAVTGIHFRVVIPPTVRVSGIVVREDMPEVARIPSGVSVSLSGPENPASAPVQPDGSFSFASIRPGTYSARVNAPGVRMAPIEMKFVKDTGDWRLVVPLMVNVSGVVTVEGGGPFPRFQLQFTKISPNSAGTAFAGPTFSTQLATGEYRVNVQGLPAPFEVQSIKSGGADLTRDTVKVTPLAPPSIEVTLKAPPSAWVRISGRIAGRARPGTTQVSVTNEQMPGPVELIRYLDGTFDIPKALRGMHRALAYELNTNNSVTTAIDATAGDVSNVVIDAPSNASDPASPLGDASSAVRVTGKITGRVRAVSDVSVSLIRQGSSATLRAPIYLDGTFEFVGVPPGTYAVEAHVAGPATPVRNIVVSDSDVRDLEVRLTETRELTGRVLVEGGGALPRRLTLMVAPGDRIPTDISADGSFRVNAASAEGIGVTSLPEGYALVSVASSGPESTELRVILRVEAPRFVAQGQIAGFSAALGQSRVWLIDSSGAERVREAEVGADGAFAFAGVTPGAYTARLVAPGLPASAAATSVVIRDRNVTDIAIAAPLKIKGTVLLEGGAKLSRFSLRLTPPDGQQGEATTVTIEADASGAFVAFLPSGQRRFAGVSGLLEGHRLISIRYGSVDLLQNLLTASASDPAELWIRVGGDSGANR